MDINLTVVSFVQVTSDAVGFGFIIRGRGPVYIHTVDENGPAAATGLTVSDCSSCVV